MKPYFIDRSIEERARTKITEFLAQPLAPAPPILPPVTFIEDIEAFMGWRAPELSRGMVTVSEENLL